MPIINKALRFQPDRPSLSQPIWLGWRRTFQDKQTVKIVLSKHRCKILFTQINLVRTLETVKAHYDEFLGSVYSWILGDFANAQQKYMLFFESIGVGQNNAGTAIDLGCGPGCQSLPLADLGYDVLAIDFCRELLEELVDHAEDRTIRTVHDDLRTFRNHITEPVDLIVCMGDTLVHLPNEEAVEKVLDDICDALKTGGKFIYAIRDYVSFAPQGIARFIPVRANDDMIFTCFLDYDDESVHVHDILHRKIKGVWQTTISDYRKLRLNTEQINKKLESNGFQIESRSLFDGMIVSSSKKS